MLPLKVAFVALPTADVPSTVLFEVRFPLLFIVAALGTSIPKTLVSPSLVSDVVTLIPWTLSAAPLKTLTLAAKKSLVI